MVPIFKHLLVLNKISLRFSNQMVNFDHFYLVSHPILIFLDPCHLSQQYHHPTFHQHSYQIH